VHRIAQRQHVFKAQHLQSLIALVYLSHVRLAHATPGFFIASYSWVFRRSDRRGQHMTMKKLAVFGLSLACATVVASALRAQEGPRPKLPLSYGSWLQLKDNPDALKQLGANLPSVAAESGPAPNPPLKSLNELKSISLPAALTEVAGSNTVHVTTAPSDSRGLKTITGFEPVQALSTSAFSPEALPAGLWSNLAKVPPGGPYNLGNPLLLTDGTVIVHRTDTSDWYKLTPSDTGSYINGTWAKIASLDSGYAPKFFASAVLPDGRVIIEGGEYNNNDDGSFTTQGAIYDPTAGTSGAWTPVSPPGGWQTIGDGQSTVLANGSFMVASCCDGPPTFHAALFNPSDLTWHETGANKADVYDEESWTLLPDGSVLTVDAYYRTQKCGTSTERYDPATGAWSAAGNVPNQLADCSSGNAQDGAPSFELGPQVPMYNGKVIAFGGTTANVAHTALYDVGKKKWSSGPDLPSTCAFRGKDGVVKTNLPCTMADAPAALLPNGNVLLVASVGKFNMPASFFEYDATANIFRAVPGTSDANNVTSFYVNFLILPTGQILAVETYTSTIQIYTPSGNYQAGWQPIVTDAPACVARGNNDYVVSGNQLNGLSQGANYGDDQQAATNYPLVRIVNKATGHVFYARTFNHNSMTVAANAPGSTHFKVASGTELGASTFYVVANGIPSAGRPVMVADKECPVASAVERTPAAKRK
jgi:hypothetical protein